MERWERRGERKMTLVAGVGGDWGRREWRGGEKKSMTRGARDW
jgi:hypothetical protein